jgi:hypothetical protein
MPNFGGGGDKLIPLSSVLPLIALSLSVYGWGRASYALVYRNRKVEHAYAAGLGVVSLTVAGGIFNYFGVATAAVLIAVSISGIVLGLAFLVASFLTLHLRQKQFFAAANIAPGLFFVATAGLALFLAINLVPMRVFNHHDDFMTYFVRAVRMQATGSTSGNPWDLLGVAGFGGDSFFHALTITWAPLASIAAFDTIFCFILGILLLAEIGRQTRQGWLLIGLSAAVFIVINPMIVNVSPVYSTAVLLLTLVRASLIFSDDVIESGGHRRYAIPIGGSLAALVAFKMTGVLFAIPFLALLWGGLLLRVAGKAFIPILVTLVAGAVAFLPWLLTQADKLPMLLRPDPTAIPFDAALTIPWSFAEAFRDRGTLYGSSRLDYAFALAAIVLMGLAGFVRAAMRRDGARPLVYVATACGALCMYVASAGFVNNEAALRYAVPFLLTGAAISAFAAPAWAGSDSSIAGRLCAIAMLAVQLGSVAVFGVSAYDRLLRIVEQNTAISYPTSREYRDWQSYVLGDKGPARIQNAQSQTVAGSRIFAWTSLPFYLDFERNQILQFNSAFFVAPWRLNTTDYDSVLAEFRKYKIDYVLVEYGSSSVAPHISEEKLRAPMWREERIMEEGAVKLLQILNQFSRRHRVIFATDGMALIHVNDR